jgi:hypothetical protein
MRVEKKVRLALKQTQIRRGYHRLALRPARAIRPGRGRRLPAGGIIVGPYGARCLASELVRREIAAGRYVTETKLAAALERLIAGF